LQEQHNLLVSNIKWSLFTFISVNISNNLYISITFQGADNDISEEISNLLKNLIKKIER